MGTDYESRLTIPLTGDNVTQFFTHSGELLATGYARIVVGARGPYVEFAAEHLNLGALRETHVPHFYYEELRTIVDDVKVYAQLRRVDYADYIPGMFYTSPFELRNSSGSPLIVSLRG